MTARQPTQQVLLSANIATDNDIVYARQRARQIGAILGFSQLDQTALATAVSEITRNALQYAGGGKIEFAVERSSVPQALSIQVSDNGPGIQNLESVLWGEHKSTTGMGIGLIGTRRLTEHFHIESDRSGTIVSFCKTIPSSLDPPALDLSRIAAELAQQPRPSVLEESQRQSRELLQALETIDATGKELQKRNEELARLNLELEETNRGAVALYAELDEKAEALRRADDLKSQFVSHVSHEFRTPMNAVLALSNLLLRRMDGDLTTEQEKQVTFIRKAASDLIEMVNDLLDLAKVESGKTEVRYKSTDVGHMLGGIRALMRPLATNDMVSLIFEEPPSLQIVTDEAKVGQILRNLVSNALKFTERGEVRVTTTVAEGGRLVEFAVQDTGIGIAHADLEAVFREFSQVQNARQQQVKGTGLGLSLSRKLATLLHGSLRVTSEVGVGSRFVLAIPTRPQTATDIPEVPNDSRPILLIDDEESARYLTRQLLRGTKRPILESSEGWQGAERARFEQPALIILDLIMIGATGFDVLEELKADPMTRDIPVVIQTSKALNAMDRERLDNKAAAIMSKQPGNRVEALCVIREILDESALFIDEPEFVGTRV